MRDGDESDSGCMRDSIALVYLISGITPIKVAGNTVVVSLAHRSGPKLRP